MDLEQFERARRAVVRALDQLLSDVPNLAEDCYWDGTSAIAFDETEHWISMDLDLHSNAKLSRIQQLIRRVEQLDYVEVFRKDEDYGLLEGDILLEEGPRISLDIKQWFEKPDELVPVSMVPDLQRISLSQYIRQKVQCLTERKEPKDWLHLALLSDQNHWDTIRSLIHSSIDPAFALEHLLLVREESTAENLSELGLDDHERELLFDFYDTVEELLVAEMRDE